MRTPDDLDTRIMKSHNYSSVLKVKNSKFRACNFQDGVEDVCRVRFPVRDNRPGYPCDDLRGRRPGERLGTWEPMTPGTYKGRFRPVLGYTTPVAQTATLTSSV